MIGDTLSPARTGFAPSTAEAAGFDRGPAEPSGWKILDQIEGFGDDMIMRHDFERGTSMVSRIWRKAAASGVGGLSGRSTSASRVSKITVPPLFMKASRSRMAFRDGRGRSATIGQ